MSGASPPPQPQTGRATGAAGATGPGAQIDPCPLCGAPLHPDQDWCLRCGAAARTRLAPPRNWKAPIIAVVVVALLSLGVLAASLVKLAGDSGSSAGTRTLAAPATAPGGSASVTSPGTATLPPASSATTRPGTATLPPASSATTRVARTAAPVGLSPATLLAGGIARLSGAVDPLGVPTTYQFQYGTATGRYDTPAPTVPAALGAGTAAVAVSVEIRVSPGTTYHYRLTATKAGRAISTAGATFTTPR